jgi:hypothetical protein
MKPGLNRIIRELLLSVKGFALRLRRAVLLSTKISGGLRRIFPCDTNPQILRFHCFLRVVLLVAALPRCVSLHPLA